MTPLYSAINSSIPRGYAHKTDFILKFDSIRHMAHTYILTRKTRFMFLLYSA